MHVKALHGKPSQWKKLNYFNIIFVLKDRKNPKGMVKNIVQLFNINDVTQQTYGYHSHSFVCNLIINNKQNTHTNSLPFLIL